MSYLDLPRLHFAGSFQADPSTVNNAPDNFDNATFNRQKDWAPSPGGNGGWNPRGTGVWRFISCFVNCVDYLDGSSSSNTADDPVIGMTLAGSDERVTAKIVDLDSEQQMVSEIWGFRLRLRSLEDAHHFSGEYEVAPFTDLWLRGLGTGSGGGDGPMGAAYQSILKRMEWGLANGSRFLRELKQTSPLTLSIKFNLDGYNMDSTNPDFTIGRMTGTIGPHFEGEPHRFVAGRLLRPPTTNNTYPLNNNPPLYFAPCKVDSARKKLIVDLGNSLATQTPGGPFTDQGKLHAAILPPFGKAPEPVGEITYKDPDWYVNKSGIQEFDLTAEQLAASRSSPLGVVQDADPNGAGAGLPFVILLSENSTGSYLRGDKQVFRLYPGRSAKVRLLALQFGERAAGATLFLRHDAELVNSKQNPFNPYSLPLGEPRRALQFPCEVKTGDDGWAEVTLTAHDPGNPRGFIDGQIYGIGYSWEPAMWPDYNADPWNFISCLVWNLYHCPPEPTWSDIEPFLKQYSNLYPVMHRIVDLASYDSVKENRSILSLAFSLPESDPNYMPVTRDLSPAKRDTLLKWLSNPELPK